MVKAVISAAIAFAAVVSNATPVAVEWKSGETMPAKVARPFSGFVHDGLFLVAGGTTHDGTTKRYVREIFLLPTEKGQSQSPDLDSKTTSDPDGIQKLKIGELPEAVGFAEGVSATVPKLGLFCAGGGTSMTDGG